jgi:Transglutaminase-like superfamily
MSGRLENLCARRSGRAREQVGRLRHLASPEGWRLLAALCLLWQVHLRLWLMGYSAFQAALCRPLRACPMGEPRQVQLEEAQRMAQALRRAARYVPTARCLHCSLAMLLWLRRRGVAANLRIGIRSVGEAVEGHAWVEWQDIILGDDPSYCGSFALLEPHAAGRRPASPFPY